MPVRPDLRLVLTIEQRVGATGRLWGFRIVMESVPTSKFPSSTVLSRTDAGIIARKTKHALRQMGYTVARTVEVP